MSHPAQQLLTVADQTVLLVEDEKAYRNAIKRALRSDAMHFLEADNGQRALQMLETNPVDLVLLDLGMPDMDGYTFLKHFRDIPKFRAIPVCVMTAWSDSANRRRVVDLGADDFVGKPVDNIELETRVKSLLRIHRYQKQLNEFNAQLESQVEERTHSLRIALQELGEAWEESRMAQHETVMRLALAAEFKDQNTSAHLHRIGAYSSYLAGKFGWSEEDQVLLEDASKMHDIGKIGIPDTILHNKGKLNEEELATMRRHPEIGAKILSGSRSKLLQMGEQIALTHHEHFDGAGYPHGLSGNDIPEAGRIVAITDVFDALLTKRPYKEPWPLEKVTAFMRENANAHFDPHLLNLFLEDEQALLQIARRYPE